MIRIYYRVSTEKQDFPMQYNAIKNYCSIKSISYETCIIYQDYGISGTIIERPDYQRLLRDVQPFDIIMVYEFSRLWRDLEEQSRATKDLISRNVRIMSPVDGEISTLTETLFADIKGSVNQFEARRLKERIKAGIAARKADVDAGIKPKQKRGPDKKPRKTDGYSLRWKKARGEI